MSFGGSLLPITWSKYFRKYTFLTRLIRLIKTNFAGSKLRLKPRTLDKLKTSNVLRRLMMMINGSLHNQNKCPEFMWFLVVIFFKVKSSPYTSPVII